MAKIVQSVAPCGLVCALCPGAAPDKGGCLGCRNGGGDADCYLRKCAEERGLDGCWQCDEFSCGNGMFGNEEWRGLGIAGVECIREHGLEGYVAILASRFGEVVEFDPFQGKRAIKATPFFEFEYDERRKPHLDMHIKCASTNRLVPLISQQPAFLQQDFFDHAHPCGGANCGRCKSRKGLGPSVLWHDGSKRTICWFMQRRFYEVNGEAVRLIRHYALLHEALLTA
jgi:hypothetical protein